MNDILSAPAFVIHLDRATERLDLVMKNMCEAGFTDIRIFKGVDGKNPDEIIEACSEFNCMFDIEPSSGQIGATLSGFKILKHIIDNNIPIATFFDDDVHFHPQWKELSEQYWNETPKDFDIVCMGNSIDVSGNTPDSPKRVIQVASWAGPGLVVTLEGAKKLLDILLKWDYKKFYHHQRGYTLSGLYVSDIMLIDVKSKMLAGQIPKTINWYCWNGTYYPCDHNRLPFRDNADSRNCGLVFQNTRLLQYSYVAQNYPDSNDFKYKRKSPESIRVWNELANPTPKIYYITSPVYKKATFAWSKK
jgi:hypothetical protein